ncbi:hypothetical protein CAEBREN_09367 [Caenorhabditis brenneri]|uniref:Uncharacterized protein n=1 Tax=Caenorhabditis brenneri TaxID=135651 RepID=G0NZ07_CAEBE|nr:hypothetical protein CAEBREN_09367 [Caenorhabditis brenneri]
MSTQSVILLLILLVFPFFTASSKHSPLPKDRQACKREEIRFISDKYQFYEDPVQLTFDSGMSLNQVLVTRILEEECGLRDKKVYNSYRRWKRSTTSRGKFSFQNYFMDFYQKSEKVLKPDLLKGIKNVVDHLKHIKPTMQRVKSAGTGKFFNRMWRDLEELKLESNDEHFDLMLEQTIRTSLQMLIGYEELSEPLLYHPNILDQIKRRIPITNGKLLSEVTVSDVKCHQHYRDSQVVLLMKLKIPVVEKKTIDKCDDIGIISHNSYQYYELPTATFPHNGNIFKVDFEQCASEDFVFCPFGALRPTECSKENLSGCSLERRINPTEIFRELQNGFAVYGSFTQVITRKDAQISRWFVSPNRLHHIIPQSGETILIDGNELTQMTHSKMTVINEM